MRRAFGGTGGGGGMGGGGGGGSMLRTVQRAVRAGVGGASQDPFSHSTATGTGTGTGNSSNRHKQTTSNILSLSSSNVSSSSSSSFSSSTIPVSATSTCGRHSCSSPVCSDDFDWEYVDGPDDDRSLGFGDDCVFGSVPSKDEVQFAVSSLQQFVDGASFSQFVKDRHVYNCDGVATDNDHTDLTHSVHKVSSFGSELDWIEPSMQLCNPIMPHQTYGSRRVFDAFNLLQSEPTVQKMVISLSSDKAVWNAVLNNDVVQELRDSLSAAEKCTPESKDDEGCDDSNDSDDSNATGNVLSWIFDNTKAKVMLVFEKITKLVNELFGEKASSGEATPTGTFEDKLRTSFLLSVVVMLIVVVTRSQRA